MIVWLASYPRSGNTFLRIVLHRLYGLPTYSIYNDDDPVAQRIGPALVGYRPRPANRNVMKDGSNVYFTKTHKRHKGDNFPAIYLVRDGRDAVVSQARLQELQTPSGTDEKPAFEQFLRNAITRPFIPEEPSSGSWGGNVLSWLRANSAPVLVRYEDLIHKPRECVTDAVSVILPQLRVVEGADIPSFAALRSIDPGFFRRGVARSHKDEMSEELHALFWAQQENAEAMKELGYKR
jgi:hypothetical protein